MTFQIKLATSQYDAVAYVRALTGDTVAPFTTPDGLYEAACEIVNEDFSRFVPLDYIVGDPVAQTSGLVTVANQQRYICSAANGFTVEPSRITDVSYNAVGALLNNSDWGALQLVPFSPLGRFYMPFSDVVDNPSMLSIRSEYRDALDRLHPGFYGVVRDPTTGRLAIDLYPTPGTANQPIYVRYQGNHANTGDTTTAAIYPTVPEAYKRQWAELLYCQVVEQLAVTAALNGSARVGILQEGANAQILLDIARRRERVRQQLGGSLPAVEHTG